MQGITLLTHLVEDKAFQLFPIELAWFSLQDKIGQNHVK